MPASMARSTPQWRQRSTWRNKGMTPKREPTLASAGPDRPALTRQVSPPPGIRGELKAAVGLSATAGSHPHLGTGAIMTTITRTHVVHMTLQTLGGDRDDRYDFAVSLGCPVAER